MYPSYQPLPRPQRVYPVHQQPLGRLGYLTKHFLGRSLDHQLTKRTLRQYLRDADIIHLWFQETLFASTLLTPNRQAICPHFTVLQHQPTPTTRIPFALIFLNPHFIRPLHVRMFERSRKKRNSPAPIFWYADNNDDDDTTTTSLCWVDPDMMLRWSKLFSCLWQKERE